MVPTPNLFCEVNVSLVKHVPLHCVIGLLGLQFIMTTKYLWLLISYLKVCKKNSFVNIFYIMSELGKTVN